MPPVASASRLRMKAALVGAVSVLLAVVAAGGWLAFEYLGESDDRLRSLFEDRLVAVRELQVVRDTLDDALPRLISRAGRERPEQAAVQREATQIVDAARAAWGAFLGTRLASEETRLARQADQALADVWHTLPGLIAQLGDAQSPWVADQTLYRARETWAPTLRLIDALSDMQVSQGKQALESARGSRARALVALTTLASVAVAITALLAYALIRRYRLQQAAWTRQMSRASNLQAALSAANKMLTRMSTADALWSEVCDICVRTGHADIASVVLKEGDEAVRVARAGEPSYFAGLPERWPLEAADTRRLISNVVIRTGRSATIADLEQTSEVPRWRPALRAHGIKSLGAFPVRSVGGVVGALVLHSKEQHFFDAEVCRLLDELANDVSFTLDVLEARQAHEAARGHAAEMERLFHQLFELMPVTVILSDANTHELIEVNEAACERYGLPREVLIGKTMVGLGVGPTPLHRQELLRQIAQHGQVSALEIEGVDARGAPYQSLVYARQIDYGGRQCLLSSSMDITARKAMQTELLKKAEADAALRAKTVFVAQMSHEVRTPLNAMLGFTQLLKERVGAQLLPEHQQWLAHIQEAGWFLLSLTDDVLDLSRIELGRMDVTLAPIQLASLVDEAIRLVMSRRTRDGIQVSSTVPQHLIVRCDRKRMQQVLVNVLSNAVKYNREGGTVAVEAAADERNVCLRIVDTGVGLTEKQLGQLFEPFNRLGRETGDVEGFGIGLALTRELVQLMQGQLDVRSQVDVGTTVTIVLPLDVLVQTVRDRAAPSPLISAEARMVQGKILYIEDNEINVLVVRQALLALPRLEFEVAVDGASGLEACSRIRPDLVLLDMQLPDMSGLDVLKRMKLDRRASVIALSANAMPLDIETAKAAGADDYLTKPLDLRLFLATVVQHLKAA